MVLLLRKFDEHDDGLGLFFIIWSLAIFFHFEWAYLAFATKGFASESLTLPELAIIIAAPIVISTLRRDVFLIMIVAQLVDCYQMQPKSPNHWQLVAIVNIAYLLSEVWAYLTRSSRSVIFRRSLTVITIAFYGFATFWKLTFDFFDPSSSCAAAFFTEIPILGSLTPKFLIQTIPITTILIEALIPTLIALRKYKAAFTLGTIFHFTLALNLPRSFVNFSGVMYTLLIGSCSTEAFYKRSLLSQAKYRKIVALIIPGTLIYVLSSPAPQLIYMTIRFLTMGVLAAYLLYLALGSSSNRSGEYFAGASDQSAPKGCKVATIIPTTLLILIGISPILGIRNGSAWQMYGNLVLTSDKSNHLILPPSFNLLNFQGHEVEVTYADGMVKVKEFLSLAQECQFVRCREGIKSIKDIEGTDISIDLVIEKSKNLTWFERKVVRLYTSDEMIGCRW